MSVTKRAIWQATAEALDDVGIYTASGGSTSTAVLPALVNGQANPSSAQYNRRWLFNIAAEEQRAVRPGGYTASTGTLTFDPVGTAVANGTTIALTGLFSVKASGAPPENTSYSTFINRGCSKLLVPRQITLPITTSHSYPLAAYPYLNRPERLLGVREPDIRGRSAKDASSRNPRLVLNAQAPTLELDVPFIRASGSLILDVLVPATTWIFTSGTWATSTTGLVFENEEINLELNEAVAATLVEATGALLARGAGQPVGRWQEIHDAALAELRSLRYFDRTLYVDAAPTQAAA